MYVDTKASDYTSTWISSDSGLTRDCSVIRETHANQVFVVCRILSKTASFRLGDSLHDDRLNGQVTG